MSSFGGLPPTYVILVPTNDPTFAQGRFLFQLECLYTNTTYAVKPDVKMAHESLIGFKILLQKMENDLGLSDLSDVETKVFLAISDLCNQFETAKTQAVLQHELVASIGRATIFRAIKKLEDRDKIAKSQDQYGAYSIADSAM
jgi:hypothetical protein